MRKLIRSLAAAAAATAALSLIPLALAGAASASTKPTESTAVGTSNWAGYVAKTPGSYSIASQFGWVQASFTVPKVTCSDSTQSSLQGKRPAGQLYSAAAFWVGLGGMPKKLLEQDGIMALCGTKTGAPAYGAFYEMVPVPSSGSAVGLTLYNKAGKGVVIHAGDKIIADTWDYHTQSLSTSHHYAPGRVYKFLVTDVTQGAKSKLGYQIFNVGVLGSDNSAEVVSEAINNGPWAGPDYTGIAHFQPVSYTGITVGMNGGGYSYGIGHGPSWTAVKYYVHSGPVGGLFGTLLFAKDRTLINAGALSQGGTAFTTVWHQF
jgi:hypothetical protein